RPPRRPDVAKPGPRSHHTRPTDATACEIVHMSRQPQVFTKAFSPRLDGETSLLLQPCRGRSPDLRSECTEDDKGGEGAQRNQDDLRGLGCEDEGDERNRAAGE